MVAGAGFNGAAFFRTRSHLEAKNAELEAKELQRSRVLSNAESYAAALREPRVDRASTEPRSFERGVVERRAGCDDAGGASTEPRSFERGVLNGAANSSFVYSLQRSRVLSNAESQNQHEPRHRHRRFNGAAFFRTRSPRHGVIRHPCRAASTEPRSFERGVFTLPSHSAGASPNALCE